jgi:anaerobic magnesium-protoporphyrin IX monomethyl ester cyclase
VLQFSRGCPHPCTYCGQTGFWTRWRRRDPKKFAAEIAWLHRVHGVELINLADENPTSSRRAWKEFCEAMIAENVPVTIVGSTRADDIVRDADILHLYRKAGVVRWLMGTETTDEATLKLVRKGGAVSKDAQAIRLLRAHGIVSLATWVVGFQDETLGSLRRQFKNLRALDPDQITAMYVTPHRWTPFYEEAKDRPILLTDRTRWDYKHQVLATRLPAPVLFLAVKVIEVMMQARPKALARTFFVRDAERRHAMRWYAEMGRRVWLREMFEFFFDSRRVKNGPSLGAFSGAAQTAEAQALAPPRRDLAVEAA